MVVEIELSKKGTKYKGMYKAIVDDIDKDLQLLYWTASVSEGTVYATRNGTSLHRMIMETVMGNKIPDGMVVDHIDGNGLNNTRDNLRIVTVRQNAINRRNGDFVPGSGYKGVTYHPETDKYEAGIYLSLGHFTSAQEAHSVYRKAHIEHYKEFSPYYGTVYRYVHAEVEQKIQGMLSRDFGVERPLGSIITVEWEEDEPKNAQS